MRPDGREAPLLARDACFAQALKSSRATERRLLRDQSLEGRQYLGVRSTCPTARRPLWMRRFHMRQERTHGRVAKLMLMGARSEHPQEASVQCRQGSARGLTVLSLQRK